MQINTWIRTHGYEKRTGHGYGQKLYPFFTPTFKLMSMFICKFCNDHLKEQSLTDIFALSMDNLIKFRYFFGNFNLQRLFYARNVDRKFPNLLPWLSSNFHCFRRQGQPSTDNFWHLKTHIRRPSKDTIVSGDFFLLIKRAKST